MPVGLIVVPIVLEGIFMNLLFKRGIQCLLAVIVTAALLQPANAQTFGNGAMFADGRQSVIFHSFTSGNGNIVELSLVTGKMREITSGGRNDRWPALNAAQDQLVFISQRTPPWKIYRINRDGSDLRLLTDQEGMHLGASWSPDGKKIVFSHQDLDAEGFVADLWVMDADGGHKTKLIDRAMWPSWDRAGDIIYFTVALDDGNVALGVYNFETKTRSILTDGALNATGAGVTPDGKFIYVSAMAHGKRTLHRVNRDGSDAVNLEIPSQQDSSPRVSPDGRFLLYGYNDGNGTEIYLLNLTTSVLRNLSREYSSAD